MEINKRQEILLWVSGLLLSWWSYIRFSTYIDGKIQIYLDEIGSKNLSGAEQGLAFEKLLLAKLNYTIPLLLQFAIPLLLITGLLFISLRARGKNK